VFEVSSPDNEEFGEQRLRDAIERRVALPLEKIFTEVIGEIHEFSSTGFDDDVCIVGVEITLK
jgi:serine phosphatase RsbU (regulator of sigma subunit)